MHPQVVGMQKLCDFPYLPSTSISAPYEPLGETFDYLIFAVICFLSVKVV